MRSWGTPNEGFYTPKESPVESGTSTPCPGGRSLAGVPWVPPTPLSKAGGPPWEGAQPPKLRGLNRGTPPPQNHPWVPRGAAGGDRGDPAGVAGRGWGARGGAPGWGRGGLTWPPPRGAGVGAAPTPALM